MSTQQGPSGGQQPAGDILALLTRIEGRLDRLENATGQLGASVTASVLDLDEADLLNPLHWTFDSVRTDIQRTALMSKLKKYFLQKAIDDDRRFDVRQGEVLLRFMEKLLEATVAVGSESGNWPTPMLKVLQKCGIEELLSLKILAEDGVECQKYFDSLRLSKALPDSLQKMYTDVKTYRRQTRQVEIAAEAAVRAKK